MKKRFPVIAMLSLLCCFTACNVSNVYAANTTDKLSDKVIAKSAKVLGEPEGSEEVLEEITMEDLLGNSKGNVVIISDNYSEALTKKERKQLKKKAKKFYKNKKKFPYKLLSLRLADDSNPLYKDYPKYTVGNIIIFQAETTHAGKGVYRFIVFARKDMNSKWKRINEGY